MKLTPAQKRKIFAEFMTGDGVWSVAIRHGLAVSVVEQIIRELGRKP